tara:strand:- start:828 stop:938 length:111 start_codon:yes stop_codon:yes gene_type:complete
MSEFFTILGGLLLGIIPIVMGSIIVAIAINAVMQKR